MGRELYSALSGATAAWSQMEVLSNNLANMDTAGYKAQRVTFSLDGPSAHPLAQAYAAPAEISASLEDGAVQQTGNPLDVALQGEGYFVVGDSLTRDGRFRTDAEGRLLGAGGLPVMGQSGPIEVPNGETLRIATDGRVFGSESGEIGRLRIVSAKATPAGSNLWEAKGPLTDLEEGFTVTQGALEGSNVNPMGVMVELIEASRYFEAYQKAMQTSDELDEALNNNV